MELWVGALNLGFLYAFMTMGVFITFRVQDFPDITVDGSFTTGASVAAVLIVSGVNPFLALAAAFLAGSIAGALTAFIHTRLAINGLLAGILVMTGLYSINLHVMGRSNIPLLNRITFLTYLQKINPGLPQEIWVSIFLLAFMIFFWLLASLFFKSDAGISMRSTGNNATMAAASGVNVDRMKILSVGLANGLVGLSGGMVAQYQGFADIGMGIGTIVIGLAAVIIGESVIRSRSIYARIMSVILGALIFRFIIASALYIGMNPIDLKLLTAAFVLTTLVVSKSVSGKKSGAKEAGGPLSRMAQNRRLVRGSIASLCIVAAAFLGYRLLPPLSGPASKMARIGVLQVVDHGMLNLGRDSFVEEMKRLGYKPGENCVISLQNANGDLPTVNTILDKFVQDGFDVIVPISTPCTQAAIHRVKDRPVVFTVVANPFIIGAGKSETEHLPNVTGVYGSVPMDKTMEMVRRILPGPLRIGSLWDPAHANSVFNAEQLMEAIKGYPDVTLLPANITSSSEVYEAALSLVQKGIDALVLVPDNIVYSAFESVVKAARAKKIPIWLSDVERIGDGAFCALGYDYSQAGIQAARLVDRILKGEKPGDIPFERYNKLIMAINEDTAKELGKPVPPEVLADFKDKYGCEVRIVGAGADSSSASSSLAQQPAAPASTEPPRRLALFLFNDNKTIQESSRALVEELEKSGILEKKNIVIDHKNAQNELHMTTSVAQEIVMKDYDYVITLTTPALQAMAQANKKIPHVFGVVTDPYRMGVAKTNQDHLPQLTGVASLQPVEATLRTMRELYPAAKRIGIVWNPGEACSEACTYKARDAAKTYGFELLEATVSGTSEVLDAVKSLMNRDIDLFLTSGDSTVNLVVESIGDLLKQRRIPYFTNDPLNVRMGASLVSLGADYAEVGRQTAYMAVRVINGEDPKDIPILDFSPEQIHINTSLAEEYGLKLPEALLSKAANIKR
jgi:putative ABC transport system permease protein